FNRFHRAILTCRGHRFEQASVRAALRRKPTAELLRERSGFAVGTEPRHHCTGGHEDSVLAAEPRGLARRGERRFWIARQLVRLGEDRGLYRRPRLVLRLIVVANAL